MSLSTLTAFDYIAENSLATPGLFNRIFSQLSDNIGTLNEAVTNPGILSGSTWASIGLTANSSNSDYIRMADSSGQRSTYHLGSHAGGTADGLNIWDDSGQTMIASFSKQSIRFYQQVVGPVFDINSDFVNAATQGTGADSTETRIQAAINQASQQGKTGVYLPRAMYPYSASSVSFINTIRMVREGGDWSECDVFAYGAYGDGTDRDSAAWQACINGAVGKVAKFPKPTNYYSLSTDILVTAGPVSILADAGAEVRQSRVSTNVFQISTHSIEIANFTMSGAAGLSSDRSGALIRASGSSTTRLRGITIRDNSLSTGNYGFLGQFVDEFEIRDNQVRNIYYGGIFFESCATGRIHSNDLRNITGTPNAYGIAVTRSAGTINNPRTQSVRIFNNVISGVTNWEGIDTHAGQDITIYDNSITDVFYGIGLNSDSDGSALVRCVVRNNDVRAGTVTTNGTGIFISGSTVGRAGDCKIVDNTIEGFGSTGADTGSALFIQETENAIVRGNSVVSSTQAAIKLLGTNNNAVVADNQIRGITLSGPYICAIGMPTGSICTGVIRDNAIDCDSAAAIRAASQQSIHVYNNDIKTSGLHHHLDGSYFRGRPEFNGGIYIESNQSVSLTPNLDKYHTYVFTATADIGIGAATGRAQEGMPLRLMWKSAGGPRTISWNAVYLLGTTSFSTVTGKGNTAEFKSFDQTNWYLTGSAISL